MSTTLDDGRINPSAARQALEWGLASLIMGGVLALLAVLVLQINLHLFATPAGWAASDLRAVHHVAVAGCVVLGAMCVASIGFAIVSLVFAYHRGQPSALGWAGLMISILALLLWIGTLIDLFEVVEMLMRRPMGAGLF
jgi:hypothetical protein